MGRGRRVIQKIEDKKRRERSFRQRRTALLKKAHELAVVCDVEVGVIIFSSSGKLFEYCSQSSSMQEIIRRYQGSETQIVEHNEQIKQQHMAMGHQQVGNEASTGRSAEAGGSAAHAGSSQATLYNFL